MSACSRAPSSPSITRAIEVYIILRCKRNRPPGEGASSAVVAARVISGHCFGGEETSLAADALATAPAPPPAVRTLAIIGPRLFYRRCYGVNAYGTVTVHRAVTNFSPRRHLHKTSIRPRSNDRESNGLPDTLQTSLTLGN